MAKITMTQALELLDIIKNNLSSDTTAIVDSLFDIVSQVDKEVKKDAASLHQSVLTMQTESLDVKQKAYDQLMKDLKALKLPEGDKEKLNVCISEIEKSQKGAQNDFEGIVMPSTSRKGGGEKVSNRWSTGGYGNPGTATMADSAGVSPDAIAAARAVAAKTGGNRNAVFTGGHGEVTGDPVSLAPPTWAAGTETMVGAGMDPEVVKAAKAAAGKMGNKREGVVMKPSDPSGSKTPDSGGSTGSRGSSRDKSF